MATYTTEQIRNLVLVGTAASGKTTLAEAMLAAAGVIGRAGTVEAGNTVSDWDELEHQLGHSIDSSLVALDHDGSHFNILDTPGRGDFIGKAISSLPAVETMVLVLDSAAGIDPVARRMMKTAKERNLPCAIVINKIDAGGDIGGMLNSIKEVFGSECCPINLPCDNGSSVIRCFQETDGDSDLGSVADFHTQLVDQIVEVDEELMEKYLDAGELAPDELLQPFRLAMRQGHLIPVCFTAARDNVGVAELMDQIARLFPNPTEGNPRPLQRVGGDGREGIEVKADDSGSPVGHCFKVASDPFVGKLCFFRVHQGSFDNSTNPKVGDGRKGVRLAHLYHYCGKNHEEVHAAVPGDIVAVSKVDEIGYDDVLHLDSDGWIAMDSVGLPKPMFGLAIEASAKGSEAKLGDALAKMSLEDPTFVIERNSTTKELVVRGIGELHLRAKLKMLKDRYGVEVDTRPPKVAYKETITGKAEGHHRHKKQTGGSGQFGEVYLRIEPVEESSEGLVNGLEFVDDTFGGSVPKQYLPAIEKGVRRVMSEGAIAGYPMQGIKVAVYDGKHHPVDSKEIAFMTAGRRAFVEAVQKAAPVLLEPFVKLEITIPSSYIGDISSDLSGRRGRIQGTDMLPGDQAVVSAEAPLSEVMSYANQLKSMTGGSGSYVMEYSHDENTPPNVQAAVVAAFKPQDDDE
ncbi:MAG: elongation factor G [Phycisphaerales bacterium]|jgi:elongation factor G|nr:elongation factor G [Phycisphaerales bacterium]